MIGESLKTIKFIKHFRAYHKSEDEVVRKRALLYLKELLKTEGGILTKFLQYKGTSPHELAEINELTQQKLEGIPIEEIRSILSSSLGDKADDVQDLSDFAIAASVGQVHFAQIDGKSVAIKVQYPNIKKTFLEQLKIFKILPTVLKASPLKKWGIDIGAYQKKLQQLIEQECDYKHEASELKKWNDYLGPLYFAHVPLVLENYSTDNIITQTQMKGVLVEGLGEITTPKQRKQMGENLIHAYFHLLFNHGVTQGDTNHGNFLFNTKSNDVYFIDLGQTIEFTVEFKNAILYLVDCRLNDKDFSPYSFLVAIGFDAKKLIPLENKLNLIVEILFQPLFANYANNLNNWDYKKELDLLLGEDKWWFRSAGGTEFFLFMKSFMGVKNLICKLDVDIFYRGILKEISESINGDHFEIPILTPTTSEEVASDQISISVMEGEREKVKMTLPFMAIFELEQYFNETITKKIEEKNIDIKKVVQNALKDGGKPKEIFSLAYDNKVISINLIKSHK